ncbi:hypothetical protein PIROE2DRAFT_42279 [Piromyces sp. E2]|nr:hypothetical protein PIROE2DRAFT_42279 [Piromyces sp. E2]|eukprot:OUM64693.1 hypothetical protein PIROE2DRAFT_42279 [Piromyces sp. E2]
MKISTSEKSFTINRNELLGDAYTCIMKNNPRELKNTIKIKYNGEEGIDAGGLLRDFFYNLGKEIGNPDYLLFQYVNDHSYDLIINKQGSQIQSNYLEYYKFVGRILGLTILHKQSLPISFSLLFYKKLLDIPLKLSDIKFVDEELYKNLNWLKENNGSENLFLSFELEETDCFGKHNIINLKPNGKNINVNDSNKDEYIELVMRKKLSSGDEEEQMMAVKEGFYEIIPKEIQNIMNEVDLSLLISGISEIDIQDWKNNTNYIGYNEDDITIVNFWRCVNDFSDEKRKQLLLFVTGNSKLPVTGFKDLQGSNGKKEHFTIRKLGKINDLPKSHTCCNYLSIPPYTSYTKLKQKLLYSITEGIDSFQIG